MASSSLDLNKILRQFYGDKVAISSRSAERARNLLYVVTQDLLEVFRETDDRFSQFYYAGSAFDRVQVANSSKNDFDLPMAINGKNHVVIDDVIPGHARVRPVDPADPYFKGFLDDQGYILPQKLLTSKMMSLVHHATNKLNKMYAEEGMDTFISQPSLNGPALQLSISRGSQCISVDIVPSIKMSEDDRYVAKPYKDSANGAMELPSGVNSSTLWRKSYSVEERKLLCTIDAGGGCRKQLLRILKAMRNEDPTLKGLTSYHLKTLLLHENAKLRDKSDWAKEKLGERFMGLLDSLKQSLEPWGTLPNYFIPAVDLYAGMSSVTRQNIQGRVSHLLNSDQERSKVLQTDYKGPPGMHAQ